MTTREIAKKRFDEMNVEVLKCQTFDEFLANYKCHNIDETFADLNYRECCFTILNDNGKPVLSKSVEVYDDDGIWLDYVDLTFNVGDKVIWHDPEEEFRDLTRVYTIYDIKGEIFCINDGFSDVEVTADELRPAH